jgi:hypothetical protein
MERVKAVDLGDLLVDLVLVLVLVLAPSNGEKALVDATKSGTAEMNRIRSMLDLLERVVVVVVVVVVLVLVVQESSIRRETRLAIEIMQGRTRQLTRESSVDWMESMCVV